VHGRTRTWRRAYQRVRPAAGCARTAGEHAELARRRLRLKHSAGGSLNAAGPAGGGADWQEGDLEDGQVELLHRPDGSLHEIGSGAYGKVGRRRRLSAPPSPARRTRSCTARGCPRRQPTRCTASTSCCARRGAARRGQAGGGCSRRAAASHHCYVCCLATYRPDTYEEGRSGAAWKSDTGLLQHPGRLAAQGRAGRGRQGEVAPAPQRRRGPGGADRRRARGGSWSLRVGAAQEA